jgi:hypothetical protein
MQVEVVFEKKVTTKWSNSTPPKQAPLAVHPNSLSRALASPSIHRQPCRMPQTDFAGDELCGKSRDKLVANPAIKSPQQRPRPQLNQILVLTTR